MDHGNSFSVVRRGPLREKSEQKDEPIMYKSMCLLTTMAIAMPACQMSPKAQKAEARVDLAEARKEHSQALRDAARENDARERREALNEADKELAEARGETQREINEAERDAKYGKRFQLRDRETKENFYDRAMEHVERIESQLAAIENRTQAERHADDVEDVREHLKEARKDLQEIQSGDHGIFDDGKVGVRMAINEAARELEELANDTRARSQARAQMSH